MVVPLRLLGPLVRATAVNACRALAAHQRRHTNPLPAALAAAANTSTGLSRTLGWDEERRPAPWSCPYEARALAVAALARFAARPLLASSTPPAAASGAAAAASAAVEALAAHLQATLAPPDPRAAAHAAAAAEAAAAARAAAEPNGAEGRTFRAMSLAGPSRLPRAPGHH
jgi:hypothetical protein